MKKLSDKKVNGEWSMVNGEKEKVHSPWSIVHRRNNPNSYGLWSMVHGLNTRKNYGLWTMVYGLITALCTSLNTASAQTQTSNYIITQAPRISGITTDSAMAANNANKNNVQISIQYVDGLGRPIQTLQKYASPKSFDMILPQAYDVYGREVKKYLPYAPETGTAGTFRPTALNDDSAFYASPPTGSNVTAITDPWAQTVFDNSPLNRTLEQGAPGVDWQPAGGGTGGHTVKMIYTENNSISFATDSINGMKAALYYTVVNSDFSQTLHAGGYYLAGQLTVTVMKDENWVSGRAGTVEEYKDIDGHVVLKRQYNYVASGVQMISTYYVYDDLGRLAFVLPPASGADGAGAISTNTLKGVCYQYRYDEYGRPEAKRIPGKGWQYMVYNMMDQPVATQDSLQGIAKQWVFTKYDAMGRVAIAGIWNNGGTAITRAALQSTLDGITTNLFESPVATGNGYSNVAWPTTNVTITLGVDYYDGNTMPGVPVAFTAPTGANPATRGELTGTQTNVLGTSNMLWTAHFYDNWGRSLESFAQHYLGGTISANNYDAVTTTYNFTNAPTTVTRKHWTSASTANPLVTVYNKYIYDWVGRKGKTWEQITNGGGTHDALTLVSQTQYNEINQLTFKKLHSTDSVNYLQTITYHYNERGWLTQSSAPLFAITLYYNTNAGFKAWNGNIMYQYWGTPGALNNHWTYKYDKLNRLGSGITSLDNYQESNISYTVQGGLNGLTRYQAGTEIDKLSYNYNVAGVILNQLQSVTDTSGSNLGLVNGTTSYTYDGNGNMLSAANTVNMGQNKSFTYNILNLPNVVTVPNGTDTYTYDATGDKLRKVSVISGVTKTTDYIGGIEYDNSTTAIGFIQTEEGKAVPNGATAYDYNYYLADNLGNTRITFGTKTGSAVTYQQDDYYPFGMEILRTPPVPNPKNEYLYNKKELQEDFNEYDYGARFYDPVIARWNTIDPLAEVSRRWSPYNYVMDNPIRLIDPDGMDPSLARYMPGYRDPSNTGIAEDLLNLDNLTDASYARTAAIQLALGVASVATGIDLTGGSGGQQGKNATYNYGRDDQQQTGKNDKKTLGDQTVSAEHNTFGGVSVDNGSDDPATLTSYEPEGDAIQYRDGSVQNYVDNHPGFPGPAQYAAVFTDKGGNLIVLPGVQISSVAKGSGGATPGTGTIHLGVGRDPSGRVINGLIDLEHEYGHQLDAYHKGWLIYAAEVDGPSTVSATFNTLEAHLAMPFELRATKLAIDFFGPNSLIARKRSLYTKHLIKP